MLLEGRGGDYLRPNSWSEEKVGGTRGVRSGTLRSGQLGSSSVPEDYRGRSGGHKHSASNHKQRERWTDSPATVSWTSHHRSHNHSSGSSKLLELDEEKMSNYEMEMKPLMRMDSYMQEIHTQKRHYSKGGPCRSMADDHRGEERGFGVQRLRSKSQNKENFRPASSAEPTVQKLENLRFGDKAEPRLLRWDLTFSPPQKSLPVALESEEDNGDALKSSTVSRQKLCVEIWPGNPVQSCCGIAELLWYCRAEPELSQVFVLSPLPSPILHNSLCWKLVWAFLCRMSRWEQQVIHWGKFEFVLQSRASNRNILLLGFRAFAWWKSCRNKQGVGYVSMC